MVRNHSCCTATANCLFAPYLSIYSLVALVSLYRPECNYLSVEYAFPIVTNQNLTPEQGEHGTDVADLGARYHAWRLNPIQCWRWVPTVSRVTMQTKGSNSSSRLWLKRMRVTA